MAWYRQAASHYLSQCWPRSLSPYGVTRPQWVKITTISPRGQRVRWLTCLPFCLHSVGLGWARWRELSSFDWLVFLVSRVHTQLGFLGGMIIITLQCTVQVCILKQLVTGLTFAKLHIFYPNFQRGSNFTKAVASQDPRHFLILEIGQQFFRTPICKTGPITFPKAVGSQLHYPIFF